MSTHVRYLFDECLGKPSMEQLRLMVSTESEFAHILDFFDQKTPDNVWIPKIASDGEWIIITSDGGRQSKKGDKLPELCKEYGITHVVLSPKLHQRRAHEKISALSFVWEQITKLELEPPGCRFDLQIKQKKGSSELSFVLVKHE